MGIKQSIILGLLSLLLFACNSEDTYEVNGFESITNFKDSIIYLDYNNAIDGFEIPSQSQTNNGYFTFEFELVNNQDNKVNYSYKIYYQNESYKFNELTDSLYNKKASENFYGSYSNGTIFKTVTIESNSKKTIIDSVKIIGNPRFEERYLGVDKRRTSVASEDAILKQIEYIKSDQNWLSNIKKKAQESNKSLDQALRDDAKYIIETKLKEKTNNNWQRNPRVGKYEFALIVTPASQTNLIPNYVKDISKDNNGEFFNPFFFLKHDSIVDFKVKFFNNIRVIAKPNLIDNKIYYIDEKDDNGYISNSKETYQNSALEVYLNQRNKDIPVQNIQNLVSFEEFSKNQYQDYLKSNDRKKLIFTNTDTPEEVFKINKENRFITFKNPAATAKNKIKQNVGIKTRHGFTYGTYLIKVKMSELLNKDGLWNGLTNAIWLCTEESNDSWNSLRKVPKEKGYMPYYGAGKNEQRIQTMSYSEIDFEIVKAAQMWPSTSYKEKKERPEPDHTNNVMVTCTNWDMACLIPDSFNVGAYQIPYKNQNFEAHRWDHWYNANTIKTPKSDDELFNKDYYYFQIEWKPTEIIWSIGREPEKLEVVGYMNDTYSSIPNNQMILILTQEYHHSEWWPNAPFLQENIPFFSNSFESKLFEITIK